MMPYLGPAACRPRGSTKFARVHHIFRCLASKGAASFVFDEGRMSSNRSGQNERTKNIVDATPVDCKL